MEKGKQTILQGALILTASTMVVKVIGALFKIPLANILGGVGMSYLFPLMMFSFPFIP